MSIPKAIFCWSGGKDSAYCLHKVMTEKNYAVQYLLTTVHAETGRISMHGIRERLLEKQVNAIGISLLKVFVSEGTNTEYEKQMEAVLLKAISEGIHHVIFGDINLKDLRTYRENNLKKIGMQGVFPLWEMDTSFIISDFVKQGFKSTICCVNDGYLNKDWAGREIDRSFVSELPANVDPCGENGEYHSFCYNGPLFKKKVDFTIGEKVYKPLEIKLEDSDTFSSNVVTRGFWFCDLKD